MSDEKTDVSRVLGGLEARTGLLEQRMATLEREIKDELRGLYKRIGEVHEAVVSARGSWRAVAWIISTGIALGLVLVGWLARTH